MPYPRMAPPRGLSAICCAPRNVEPCGIRSRTLRVVLRTFPAASAARSGASSLLPAGATRQAIAFLVQGPSPERLQDFLDAPTDLRDDLNAGPLKHHFQSSRNRAADQGSHAPLPQLARATDRVGPRRHHLEFVPADFQIVDDFDDQETSSLVADRRYAGLPMRDCELHARIHPAHGAPKLADFGRAPVDRGILPREPSPSRRPKRSKRGSANRCFRRNDDDSTESRLRKNGLNSRDLPMTSAARRHVNKAIRQIHASLRVWRFAQSRNMRPANERSQHATRR